MRKAATAFTGYGHILLSMAQIAFFLHLKIAFAMAAAFGLTRTRILSVSKCSFSHGIGKKESMLNCEHLPMGWTGLPRRVSCLAEIRHRFFITPSATDGY